MTANACFTNIDCVGVIYQCLVIAIQSADCVGRTKQGWTQPSKKLTLLPVSNNY